MYSRPDLVNDNYLPMSATLSSDDAKLFISIWDQGIDAYLTAFTRSEWATTEDRIGYGNTLVFHRIEFYWHVDELSVLLRRLHELADSEHDLAELADQWENDILDAQYGVEII